MNILHGVKICDIDVFRKRKAVSHEFAKKKDLPLLEHVTLPRTGALDVVMNILGPESQQPQKNKIERIVDMTIAYPEGKPLDLQSIVFGWREPCNTHVHYRSWDIKVFILFLHKFFCFFQFFIVQL